MMYRSIAVVAVVGASLSGAYAFGYNNATVIARNAALAVEVENYVAVESLIVKLHKSDEALLIEQKRTAKVRNVEVIKYVTKYRDRIVSAKCINDSGLFNIINASMPTVSGEQSTSGLND